MRKILFLTLTIFTLTILSILPAFAQEAPKEITVTIDDLSVDFDVPPIIKNGRTLVPFRALAEALNVKVNWNETNQTIIATNQSTIIQLQIGNNQALQNQISLELDMPPIIEKNRTLVPLRFFSKAFYCQVEWKSLERKIEILSPPKAMNVVGFYALGDKNTSSWTNLFKQNFPNTSNGNTDVIKELALGWYSMDKNGLLLTKSRTGWQRPDSWEEVLIAARKYNLKTEMVIHLTNGDGTITELINNDIAINNAAHSILSEARLYKSVNLDFEGLGLRGTPEYLTTVRNNFTHFVKVLADKLKQENITLTLTLHAPNSSYQGYDYQALGKIADKIIIMAYDYGSKPEPISLVRQAVEMASEVVPVDKLILGISLPSETPDSILAKIGLAKRYNLNGIALWRLGLISNEVWDNLRSTIK